MLDRSSEEHFIILYSLKQRSASITFSNNRSTLRGRLRHYRITAATNKVIQRGKSFGSSRILTQNSCATVDHSNHVAKEFTQQQGCLEWLCPYRGLFNKASTHMPDSHKFVHYHWIRVYINHARAEIARVEIRYSLFQKQEKNHLHQQWGKTWYKIDKILLNIV